MHKSRLGLMISLLLISSSCSPVVSTHSKPHGPKVFAKCINIGEDTMVSLSIIKSKNLISWQVKFIDDTPDDLTTEEFPSKTVVMWKIDKSRIKTNFIQPYSLNLISDNSVYSLSVDFLTTSQQIGVEIIRHAVVNFVTHL